MPRRADLRAGSIASIILDARTVAPLPPRRKDQTLAAGRPAQIVLGPDAPGGAPAVGVALFAAAALHLALGAAARRWADDRGQPAPPVSTQALKIDHVVDLQPPPVPPEVASPSRASSRIAAISRAAAVSPPAPAAAAHVVAVEPEQAEVADLTGFDIAAGQGKEYAGGVTASSGTSATAVHAADIDRNARSGGGAGLRGRPVGLPVADWNCPWPPEAAALSIDEETVVVRVVVRPDGSVASVTLSSDPGHGFGAFAVECARAQRFRPALDDAGAAVTARSPPIRVHFARPAR